MTRRRLPVARSGRNAACNRYVGLDRLLDEWQEITEFIGMPDLIVAFVVALIVFVFAAGDSFRLAGRIAHGYTRLSDPLHVLSTPRVSLAVVPSSSLVPSQLSRLRGRRAAAGRAI